MRAYGWYRLVCVRLSLMLVLLATGSHSVKAQGSFELPQNSNPFERGNLALANVLDEVSSDRLMAHVAALQMMRTRHVDSSQGLPDQGIDAAARYIQREFESIGAESGRMEVSTQPFYIRWGGRLLPLENIIAITSGAELSLGTIVIGAHYDSRCENVNNGECFAPGANDNASGVAALIELARILSKDTHPISIMFVAFSAEEVGRQGSLVFVRDYIRARKIPVIGMINLDIIGGSAGNTNTIRLFSAGPHSSRSRQLARSIYLMSYRYIPDLEVALQDHVDRRARYGDHMSFSDAGYAAVRFIEEQEDHAHQHNSLDILDQIQPGYFRRAVRLVLASVILLADGPQPPQYIILNRNSDGTYLLDWEPVTIATEYVVMLRSHHSPNDDLYLEVKGTSMQWNKFDFSRFAGVAVAVIDNNDLMGTLSLEYLVG